MGVGPLGGQRGARTGGIGLAKWRSFGFSGFLTECGQRTQVKGDDGRCNQ